MPEKLDIFRCVHCKSEYFDELNCIEHERDCKERQVSRTDYTKRIKKMPLGNYKSQIFAFNAMDSNDLERCVGLCFSGLMWDYNYLHSYEYPCLVIISQFEVFDEFDDFATTYIQITSFEEYLSELNDVIKSLEEFFVEEDSDNGAQ